MPQDPAVARAQGLWEEKKPREAVIVLLKRVNELSVFSDDPVVAQAKELWNQKKLNAALLLLVNRINELNAQLEAAWSEPILEEDGMSKSRALDHVYQKQSEKRDEPEYKLDQVRANRYKGFMNADGGRLTITNKRLIFKPHGLNLDRSSEEILFSEVVSVMPFTAGIAPIGMKVTTRDGTEHKFVINRRKAIIDLIKSNLPR